QPQQPFHPLAVDLVPALVEQYRQSPAPVNRMLQVQLVQQTHQRQVLLALRARLVVVSAAADTQQFALVTNARLFDLLDQFSSRSDRPSCLDFFLSQSRSTVNWPIF